MSTATHLLASELPALCSKWRELDPTRDTDLAVDGIVPRLWCEPGTADELADILKLADQSGAGVLPRGGGTRMGLGLPPRRADLLLSTQRLDRILEYEPADLTVTVEAGLGLGELQRQLATEGQFLALDPPGADGATIGGTVASNASGPLRLRYGSARDLIIGTRVANADGALTKSGGRVVKNVAGYDLNKLYAGSLGTLGVIVELSFKLYPLPEKRATVVASFATLAAAAATLKTIMRSPLGADAVELLSRAAARAAGLELQVPPGGCALAILVSGFERAVSRLASEIADICQPVAQTDLRDGTAGDSLWTAMNDLADIADPARPLLKLAVPPSRLIEAFSVVEAESERTEFPAVVWAHAGVGIVYARFESCEWSEAALDRLAQLSRALRGFAVERRGSLVVETCPAGLKRRLDVWGDVGPSLRLMRSLKQQLDPRGTLNAGRYVGGI